MKLYWPLAKFGLLFAVTVVLFTVGLSGYIVLMINLLMIIFSQNLIAFLTGLEAIPAMDQATFLGDSKSVSNFSNSSGFKNAGDRDMLKARFSMMIGHLPKMRNRIVSVAGDYYYERMSLEETLEKGLIELPEGLIKSPADVDYFL